VSLNRTEKTGLLKYDSGIKRAVDKGAWAVQLEQDSLDGQQGQDSRDRTARTGKPGQENWDMKVRKTDGIVHPGQETEAERPEFDSKDRTAKTGHSGWNNRCV
jgi:hypothetical protein